MFRPSVSGPQTCFASVLTAGAAHGPGFRTVPGAGGATAGTGAGAGAGAGVRTGGVGAAAGTGASGCGVVATGAAGTGAVARARRMCGGRRRRGARSRRGGNGSSGGRARGGSSGGREQRRGGGTARHRDAADSFPHGLRTGQVRLSSEHRIRRRSCSGPQNPRMSDHCRVIVRGQTIKHKLSAFAAAGQPLLSPRRAGSGVTR